MMVASTIVPVVIFTPWLSRYRLTAYRISPPTVLFQQVPELARCGLIRHRLLTQIDAREMPLHHRAVQRLFHRWGPTG
jgi:hypothetical protein